MTDDETREVGRLVDGLRAARLEEERMALLLDAAQAGRQRAMNETERWQRALTEWVEKIT